MFEVGKHSFLRLRHQRYVFLAKLETKTMSETREPVQAEKKDDCWLFECFLRYFVCVSGLTVPVSGCNSRVLGCAMKRLIKYRMKWNFPHRSWVNIYCFLLCSLSLKTPSILSTFIWFWFSSHWRYTKVVFCYVCTSLMHSVERALFRLKFHFY